MNDSNIIRAELVAIREAINEIEEKAKRKDKIVILTDSLAASISLRNRKGLFRCKVFLYRAYILEQGSRYEMKGISKKIQLCTCIITLNNKPQARQDLTEEIEKIHILKHQMETTTQIDMLNASTLRNRRQRKG